MTPIFSQTITIPVGTTVTPAAAVPDNVSTVMLAFGNWPQANRTLQCSLEFSGDGLTWQDAGKMNPEGGARPINPRTGSDVVSMVTGPMPPGTGRRLRAIATAVGGSITTLLTISTE